MHKLLLATAFYILIFSSASIAQELNCLVTVSAEQVQTTERRVFKDMEIAFAQFLNTRKWTDDEFETDERINCNLNITINSMPSIGNFLATVQIQSARPIYNTSYESLLLNFADREWQFAYVESQPLEFNDNTFQSNLTSILAFYAYVILGLDYDSFGLKGGEAYLQKALDVVNNAQNSNRPGWNQIGSNRNRYWLIENLTNTQMTSVREGMYTYHLKALDTYSEDPDNSRKQILDVLKDLQTVRANNPTSILVISFMDAKADELVNIFSEGNMQVRKEAYDILNVLDPSKREAFEQIIKNWLSFLFTG